jgi:hypothetical protein
MFGKGKKNKKSSEVSSRLEVLNAVLKQDRGVSKGDAPAEADERLAEAVGDKDWEEELQL